MELFELVAKMLIGYCSFRVWSLRNPLSMYWYPGAYFSNRVNIIVSDRYLRLATLARVPKALKL